MRNKTRRMRNTEVAPMSLEEFMWDKTTRRLLDYLGSKGADSPDSAIHIDTVSKDLDIGLTHVNYHMDKLCVTGLGAKDSDSEKLYLTVDRGMGAYGVCRDLRGFIEPP